jgi:hypothetical protein
MSSFFGIIMSSLQPAISATSVSAVANATTSSINVSSTANNRGTLTYSWQRSGTTCTINTSTSVATTFTGSGTAAGSTIVYCNITDSVTGVTKSSPECVITWTAAPVNQNIVISGTVTYNGSSQAYTLTGSPLTPAPSGTPSTFINAGTFVYPTNITSITPGSGYTLGTVSGSFVINRATITNMSFTLNTVAFTTRQYRSAGVTYTIAVSSTTPAAATYSPSSISQTTAGNYTLSSSGTGNYTGTNTSSILSLISASITQNSPRTPTVVPLSAVLSQIPPSVTYLWARTAGTVCSFSTGSLANTNCTGSGSLTSTVRCTISYTGSTTSPSTNLAPTTVIQWGIA